MTEMAGSGRTTTIWTIGHGRRSTEELAAVLHAAGVETAIDVRRYPQGRRQPHLARERLEVDLPRLGIGYEWWGDALGGRRPVPPTSTTAQRWRSPGFAAYEAYMSTAAFQSALMALEARAEAGGRVSIMCAETLWWRCHRRLIADALVADGFPVRHLVDGPPGMTHRISSPSAAVEGTMTRGAPDAHPTGEAPAHQSREFEDEPAT